MTSFTFCNDSSQRQILNTMRQIVILINQTRWIIEAYVSDFYTHSHWHKLPKSVQEFVDVTEPPDWAWLLAQNHSDAPQTSRKVIPLSLLALKCCSQYLSLERTAIDLDRAETIQDLIDVLHCESSSKKAQSNKQLPGFDNEEKAALEATPCQTPNYKNGQCMDMQHIFRKHVKPKKQHEIQQLGKVIEVLSQTTNCKSVVDVGAGLGHLSRLLTFSHGLKVTTVEAAGGHAPKAAEFDRILKKDVLKKIKKNNLMTQSEKESQDSSTGISTENQSSSNSQNEIVQSQFSKVKDTDVQHTDRLMQDTVQEEDLPSHVVGFIEPDIGASQFLEIVRKAKSEDESTRLTDEAGPGENAFILASLHACGDLTPTLLNVFCKCSSAVALVSVGCCYMKMNASLDNQRLSPECSNLKNYPMSTFLKQQEDYVLNYECREMACHFADAYCSRLKDNSVHLKVHSYRAALQYLVKIISPDFESGQTRLISKKGAQATFPEYASEMLKKLNMDPETVPQGLLHECEEKSLLWKRVVAFYTMRLSLAPAVETLILLDRMVFLRECGLNSALVPIFDPRLSPRNFALLSIRQ